MGDDPNPFADDALPEDAHVPVVVDPADDVVPEDLPVAYDGDATGEGEPEAWGDEDFLPEDDDPNADPDRPVMAVERWRRRTASGALATAIALGLQQVFQPEFDTRPAIVQETSGTPYDDDDPVVVDFEPDAPEGTTVLLRPWNR